jgi:arsenate reductase
MLRVYTYKACSTCRNATKWLNSIGIPYEEIPIRVTPPSTAELANALEAQGGKLRLLFNTSGVDYRALEMKDKLPTMSEGDAFKLLNSNGNLVKRPFATDPSKAITLVGFKADEWQAALAK